jgi:benzaldehyde dehydrogenase (NAD)
MTLLEDGSWQGAIWTGSFTPGGGGTYPVVEPATGDSLGDMGRATPADVAAAAARAVTALLGRRALRRAGPGAAPRR